MTASPSQAAPLHPWPRFFGRYLDYIIVGTILGIMLSYVLPESKLLEGNYALGWVSSLIWIPLEALCLAVIGTTPGKSLVGLSVQTADGKQLSSQQALGRSVGAWLTGCAALLPLVSLVTMNAQYNRVRLGQPASWDRAGGYQVILEPLSIARKLVLVGVVALYLFLMYIGSTATE